jgi:pimeloyl-ACP methyl ester carboxylesterase
MLFMAAGYLAICALMYSLQEQLIFLAPTTTPRHAQQTAESVPGCREVRLKTPDGTMLHGWYVKALPKEEQKPLVIWFGGNGDEMSFAPFYSDHLSGCSLVAFNYRGYGLSEGKPGERALCADAQLIYDHFAALPEVDPANIFIMGRSLGSGVAVDLARNRAARGVILLTPFDSLEPSARRQFPWLPTSLLLQHKFMSVLKAEKITAPALIVIAQNDTVVFPDQSRRLADHWKGAVTNVEIKAADHNDIIHREEAWQAIEQFILRTLNK